MLILGFYGFEFEELFPEFSFREGGTKEEFFFFNGMFKHQVEGVEVDACVRIGFGKAILQISTNGATHRCQLYANLVRSSGDWTNLQQVVVIHMANHLVVELCFLGAFYFLVMGGNKIFNFVFREPMGQFTHFLLGSSFDKSPVHFVNVSFAKEFHHSLQSFGGSGKGNQSTHWTIQSMDGM